MKIAVILLLLLCAGVLPAVPLYSEPAGCARGEWRLSSRVKMEAEADGSAVLRVALPEAEKDGQFFAVRKIDLKPFRGRPVILRAEVKAVEVSRPAQHWNGVKVMLHCKTPSVEFWRNPMGLCGTFDWQCVETRLTVPHDADEGEVSLGLQGSSGTLLIRNWELIAGELPYRLSENFKAEYTERVSGVPVLRGMMSPEQLRDGDLEELRSWGANLVRWQIIRNWLATGTDRDPEEYLGWFRSKLDELDRALELCRGLGLKLVIDLHAPPGGRHAGSDYEVALFHEPDYAEMFYELWEEIAKRYKGHPAVWGYDIMNEPVQARWPAAVDYQTLCYETARRIRAVDPEVPIIVESADWASPKGFAELQPLPFPNIVYQVHMYLPHKFTHQDVGAHRHSPPVSYPGVFDGVEYDREQLKRELRPVREFQERCGARIYVGEFSAARWAPGAAQYLEDVISICEEYGWDWSYHAFRESDVWNVEMTGTRANPGRPAEDTDRKKVLLKYFKLNGAK